MSKKNMIIFGGIAVLVLAIIGGGFFMLWHKLSTLGNVKPEGEAAKTSEKSQNSIGPLFALETFIVNLSDQGGKRYLRITMTLELEDPKYTDELNKRLPQIRDCILTILPTRKVDDLQTIEGKNSLREEIIGKLNTLLGKQIVKRIYFTDFVIQ